MDALQRVIISSSPSITSASSAGAAKTVIDITDTAIAAVAAIAAGARNLFKGLLHEVIFYVFIQYCR
jgi:hypothetical protein